MKKHNIIFLTLLFFFFLSVRMGVVFIIRTYMTNLNVQPEASCFLITGCYGFIEKQ